VVIFEQASLHDRSHIFEAIRQGDEEWKVLPRPHHHLEIVPGGPLLIYIPTGLQISQFYTIAGLLARFFYQ
jgi:hypothetical protein